MVFLCELKKLLFTPAIIGFAALCLLFNIIIIAAYDKMEYESGEEAFNGKIPNAQRAAAELR
jgi:ABC-type enterochelin transport system permease subunit